MSLVDRVRALLPPKYREFAKFLTVGGTAWTVDMTIFTVLSHSVLINQVLICKTISMVISTILSYILNREWSFNARGGRRRSHEAMLFVVFNGIGFVINLIPLWATHYLIGINTASGYSRWTVSLTDWIMANLVGTFIAMLFRYWSYRRFVFPDELDASKRTRAASVTSAPTSAASSSKSSKPSKRSLPLS